MVARYSSAIATGSIVTVGLFLLMQSLIALQPGAASEARARTPLVFVRVPEKEELITNQSPVIDKKFIEPPVVPPRQSTESSEKFVVGVNTSPTPPQGTMQFGPGVAMNDGPLVAMVRVQPVYPAKAAEQGLEGWVVVEFDVLSDGSVSNARVVESSNRIFERAAIRAAHRFRFRPRVVDGVPLETHGIQNRFTFVMEE